MDYTGALAAAWSKLEGAAARLALLLHLADAVVGTADPDSPVEADTIRAGIRLAEWFGHEARRVYGFFAETDDERDQRELVDLVQRRFNGRVTARDLMHASRKYQPTEAAESALNALNAAGLGCWETVKTRTRPRREFVLSPASPSPHSPGFQGTRESGDGDIGDTPEIALSAPDDADLDYVEI
jgi:hypothetical protein